MRQEFTIDDLPDRPVSGLRALFVPKRARLESFGILHLPPEIGVTAINGRSYGLEAKWRPALRLTRPLALTLEAQGEPAELARVLWEGSDGYFATEAEPDLLASMLRQFDFSAGELSLCDLYYRRCSEAGAHPDPKRARFGLFFCEYDGNTHPDLIHCVVVEPEATKRLLLIQRLVPVLIRRVMQRHSYVAEQKAGSLNLSSADKADVDHASELQIVVFRRHLADPHDAADAFTSFANGELRVTLGDTPWNGEPDSAQVFCFAEFAFLAIELAVEAEYWSALLPCFLAMQEIFAQAYQPSSFPRPFFFSDYRPGNWRSEQQVDSRGKLEILAKYTSHGLDELNKMAAENAFRAFPAGRQRP